MPPASFKDDDSRKAFYEKYNKKVMEKYYNDPEFRKKLLDARKAIYQRHKAEKLAEKIVVTHTL